jgi:hypothetical protein
VLDILTRVISGEFYEIKYNTSESSKTN